MIMDWVKAGEQAFSAYLDICKGSGDYDEALESFESILSDRMDEAGIEENWGWAADLTADDLEKLFGEIASQAKTLNSNELTGPLHTALIGKIFEAEEIHGEEAIAKLEKILSEFP